MRQMGSALAGVDGHAPRQRGPNAARRTGLAAEVLTSFGAGLLSATPSRANAVVSPYSVYTVLAMAATGANGRTADQLAAVLGGISPDARAGCLTAIDDAVGAALASGAASDARSAV